MTDTVKPPPIIVGVQGIDAFRGHQEPAEQLAEINWDHLIGLPPFQMFAGEVFEFPHDQYEQAMQYLLHQLSQTPGGPQELYDTYCRWHTVKGYWPLEDPMGRLIE